MTTQLEHRHVFYSGRVQGVGFRYTAQQVAQSHAVTGFVRNLEDGRVELVAEGSADELDRFLHDVASRLGRYIRTTQATTSQATSQFASFEIAY